MTIGKQFDFEKYFLRQLAKWKINSQFYYLLYSLIIIS